MLTSDSRPVAIVVQALVAMLVGATIHCVFHYFQLYDFKVLASARGAATRAAAAGIITFGPLLGALLAQPDVPGRNAAAAGGLICAGIYAIAMFRLAVAGIARALEQSGIVSRRLYLVADTAEAIEALRGSFDLAPGASVVGTWVLPPPPVTAEDALEGALAYLRANPVEAVVLRMQLSHPDRLAEVAGVLRRMPRTVLLAPSVGDNIIKPYAGAGSDGFGNLILVKLSDRPLAGWRWVMKDAQDRLIALILLMVISPTLLGIALAIKIADPGPVFFRQKRYGYAGDTFDILKFRTMRVTGPANETGTLKLTTRDDPRIYPLGKLLRKSSLDELPQLLNVLRGDMWIIGPRPHSPYAVAGGTVYARAVRDYAARYRIKPGITGWAQVNGWRGPTETRTQLSKRVEHDLYYIENWSPLFDLWILLKTVTCVCKAENAF